MTLLFIVYSSLTKTTASLARRIFSFVIEKSFSITSKGSVSNQCKVREIAARETPCKVTGAYNKNFTAFVWNAVL